MTRSLASVERFFERLLERPAARLFRAPIQPAQLQRGIERAMESGRVSRSDRTYVPNRFRVMLHPSDAAAFTERTMLQADLAEAVLRRARVRGYRLVARPEVLLLPTEEVAEGAFQVVPDVLDPGLVRSAAAGLRPVELEGPRPPRPPHPGTAPVPSLGDPAAGPASAAPSTGDARSGPGAMAVPPAPMPAVPDPGLALVEIQTRDGQPWAFLFRGGVIRVGRGTDNEIALQDDRVSRRHGQLTARHGTLVWTDLGSSNGSQVNGVRAREIALEVGDVVRVGNSTLTIRPVG